MLRNFKKFISLVLVLALSVGMSIPSFAESSNEGKSNNSVAESGTSSNDNPLSSGKEILYYLFWTQDTKLENDLISLQKDLNLSSEQMAKLKEIGLKQFKSTKALDDSSKRNDIKLYNSSVDTEATNTNQSIESVLKDSYPSFRNWIATWWKAEKNYRKNFISQVEKGTLTPNASISTHVVWATQYAPSTSGSSEVALPDKYIKFANLGKSSPYKNPPYTVNVYSSSTKRTLSNIKVKEVGPWNENDNYWDTARREFGNLSVGTPEAYDAFYDNYNNGKDDRGRKVTNAAGIDLSTTAAKAIGFGTNASGWVTVTYSDLP